MANIKFTEFPSAATVGAMDIIPIVQDGANKKATAAVFQTYIGSLFVGLAGTQTITGSKTFSSPIISSVVTGTAPFTVASTTKVTNLNADLLDGLSSAAFQSALTLTTTGTSGAATLVGSTLNIPNYGTALADYLPLAGGTLTGPLLGTTASFNSTITDTQTNASGITSNLVLENFIATNPAAGNGVAIDFRLNNSGNPTALLGKISLVNTFFRSNTDMIFSTALSDTLSEKMRITSAGNVGIGTDAPTGKLEIRGLQSVSKDLLLNLSKFDYGATQFYQNYSNTFYSGGKSLEIEVEGLPLLQLAVNNAGSAGKVIFPNGPVLIGTTVDAGYKLDVNGNERIKASGVSPILYVYGGGDSVGTNSGKGNIRSGDAVQLNYFDFGRDNLNTGNFVITSNNSSPLLSITTGGAATFSSSVTATQFTADSRTRVGGGYIADMGGAGNDTGIFFGANTILPSNGSGTITTKDLGSATYPWGAATFSGQVNIGNPVTTAAAAVSTHKVEIVIGGTTYYLLATT
jgi:hypothetical protein